MKTPGARIQINLASEPFRRDRVVLVGSAAVAAALVLVFAVLVSIIVQDRQNMRASLTQLDRLNNDLTRYTREQRKLDLSLRQSGNADVLERSEFINKLLFRKGVSWTKLFADLETVVPANVRIVSIRPQEDAHNHLFLDMEVGAESQKPVIDLLTKLESSESFGSTSVSAFRPPSQTDPLYRYRLSVSYAQKL